MGTIGNPVTVSPLLSFGPDKQPTQQQETSKSNMSVHTVLVEEEQVAFADWINDMFGKDTDVNHKLPLKKDGSDMYEAMDDGILLCKIINLAAPDTIDERAINKGKTVQIFKQHENLTLARNSASSVGVVVVGVDSHNIRSEKKQCYLVLGLVWQLIRMHLFRQININVRHEEGGGQGQTGLSGSSEAALRDVDQLRLRRLDETR